MSDLSVADGFRFGIGLAVAYATALVGKFAGGMADRKLNSLLRDLCSHPPKLRSHYLGEEKCRRCGEWLPVVNDDE